MKRLAIILLFLLSICNAQADRIYILNYSGYNDATQELRNAMVANGHSLTVDSITSTLPVGFTSRYADPVNGYDWLFLAGDQNYSNLLAAIKSFIDSGGKVFYQYEVSCCTVASAGAAALASGLTGLSIVPSSYSHIAATFPNQPPGWESTQNNCVTISGVAYKCLDGLPGSNQLNATATLNNATPPHTSCTNYGFHFSTADFIGAAHNGAFVGIGDINIYYDGDEPFWNGGTTAVNMSVVNFFFPNAQSTCYLYPPGPVLSGNNLLQVSATGTNASCNNSCNGSANVVASSGTPPYQYNWQPGNYITDSLSNLCQGIYTVVVTDGAGTTIRDTVVITAPVPPTATLTSNQTLFCSGDSAQICAPSGFTTYLWNTGQSGSCITAKLAGNYYVTVTDANGCTAASNPIIISGIENLTEDDVVSVYPNPSHNNWQLSVGNNLIGGEVEVFDANGRVVFQQLITNHQSLITLDDARGVYLLRISSAKSSVVRKLVKL